MGGVREESLWVSGGGGQVISSGGGMVEEGAGMEGTESLLP